MRSIDEVLDALEAGVRQAGREAAEVFGPPAGAERVAEAERALGAPLPADYKRFLSRLGGQRLVPLPGGAATLAQLVRGLELLSPEAAGSEHACMIEAWDDTGP